MTDIVTTPRISIATAEVSDNGRELIAHFEQGPHGGHAAYPYFCSAGACTVGFGHVVKKGETFVYPMSRETADRLLSSDLQRFTREVRGLLIKLGVIRLTQGQFDALVSMAFNLGTGVRDGITGDFADSMLINYVAQGRMLDASAQFHRWKFAGGKILGGLVRRRKCESHLFLTGQVKFFDGR